MPSAVTFTSLSDALTQRWRDAPSSVALVRVIDGKVHSTTNAELAARVIAFARRLSDTGIGSGDIVAIRSQDKTPFLVSCLATTLLGAAFVPVHWNALHELSTELVLMTGAKALVTDQRDERADSVAALYLTANERVDVMSTADLEWALACAKRAQPATLYMIQPTSGSTGIPKLVPRRHDAFLRLPWAIGMSARRDTASRILVPLTLEHGGGLYGIAVWLCIGSSLAFPEADDVDMKIEDIRLLEPSMMMMTPRVVTSIFNQAQHRNPSDAKAALGGRVQALVTGGAKSMPAALAWLEASAVKVVEIYGASEFSVIAHSSWDASWSNEYVGSLLDDVELEFAEDKELLVKTPAMMTGYVGPSAPQSFTEDGFYRTGDLAELVGDKLRILGRRRDVLNLFDGSNVYPSIVEGMIEGLPWVHQVVICGDQRPALAALIVVHGDMVDHDAGAWLRPADHPGQYELARRELARFNDALDSSEQVRHVVLLAVPFAADILSRAAIGKLKRNRKLAADRYREALDECYQRDSPYRLPTPLGRDPRHDKRYPFAGLVRLTSPTQTVFLYGRNLSLHGVKLESRLELNGEYRFQVIGHELSREVRARVVRIAHGEVALQFVEPLTLVERNLLLDRGHDRE
ncbi:MAG: AMP-dependent synthetase and ligase [Myxococcales bacterium]|nr:AMP-dependent synthetase and ligase [Myxococcales bacterium]